MTQKRIGYVWILLSILFVGDSSYAYQINGIEEFLSKEKKEQVQNIFAGFDDRCKDIQETDYPTIFIPGILASWYSSYGHGETKVKRWIPDPITHVYDTLFYTFMQNGYSLEDVFYDDEFNVYIEGNPKRALYLFGYDWKKDNTVTATLLTQLIGKILDEYKKQNGCDIGKVNIIAHSMGGLVARSMLEDMCVKLSQDSNSKYSVIGLNIEENGKIKQRNGTMFSPEIIPCTNPINPYKDIKVHKLITIATPHRGSPKAFPLWEKGDLGLTDGLFTEIGLKLQIGTMIHDSSLYKVIHGYDPSIPNGIVGIGQLLPDISQDTPYNNQLKYLEGMAGYFPKSVHPKNTFLENLNKIGNIDKLWNKVDTYTQYYSKLTGNTGKNNVTAFKISSISGAGDAMQQDLTKSYSGKDIYELYPEFPKQNIYTIQNSIMHADATGGDGTVPSLNLRLIPNDTQSGEEVEHSKFYSQEIKCYDPTKIGFEKSWSISSISGISDLAKYISTKDQYGYNKESDISRNIGDSADLEVCNHTAMPIATSIQVYENISGKDITPTRFSWQQTLLEKEKLLEYLGYAPYFIQQVGKKDIGISNSSQVEWFFRNQNYIIADKTHPISLSFGSKLTAIRRYEILSPINLLITDEQDRRIGIDPATGMIINEIPGAWTSGDTQGSNEPEVFFIPVEEDESLTHTIQSFGTGDGGYHIQATHIDMQTDTPALELFTIAGEAKQAFVETYQVQTNQQGASYSKQKTQLEIQTDKDSYTSYSSDFSVRYFISTDRVLQKAQLGYTLYDTNKKQISKNIQDIKGLIDLKLPKYGNYILELSLLDGEKVLLKKHIDIHYTQQRASHIFLDLGIGKK